MEDASVVRRNVLLSSSILLLLAEAPCHGYELAERLKGLGLDVPSLGPVYNELRLYEQAGLLRSTWEPRVSGPVPRVYELTPAGHQSLDVCLIRLAEFEELVVELKSRCSSLRRPPPDENPPPRPRRRGRRGAPGE